MANESHASSHARQLPAELGAPAFVDGWRNRALMTGAIFSIIAVILAFLGQSQDGLGWDHFLRAWTMGTMITWGFAIGGFTMLMVQYCSGGKWGLLLRRPFEAMSRTWPLIVLYWLVMAVFMKRLYLWANPQMVADQVKKGLITPSQLKAIEHCISFKRPMLNPISFWWVSLLCFAIWAIYAIG